MEEKNEMEGIGNQPLYKVCSQMNLCFLLQNAVSMLRVVVLGCNDPVQRIRAYERLVSNVNKHRADCVGPVSAFVTADCSTVEIDQQGGEILDLPSLFDGILCSMRL